MSKQQRYTEHTTAKLELAMEAIQTAYMYEQRQKVTQELSEIYAQLQILYTNINKGQYNNG